MISGLSTDISSWNVSTVGSVAAGVRPVRPTRLPGRLRIVRRGPRGSHTMAMLRFLFRRLVAQRLLALGVVLTLAFSVGVMASGPIYTEAARNSILASAIATASIPVENVRVDLYGGSSFNWAAADRQVRALSSLLPVQTIVPQGETTVRIGPSGGSAPMLFRVGGGAHLTYRSGAAPGAGQ